MDHKTPPPGYWQLTEGYKAHELHMLSNAAHNLTQGKVEFAIIDGEDGYQIWRTGGCHEAVPALEDAA